MSYPSPAGRKRRFSRWPERVFASFLAAVLGSLLTASASALPTDRDQPITITADTAVRDEKQGFTIYRGNVHMIQGSMDIVADVLTIYHETEQADKIVAEGKPAKMQQRPEIGEPMVRARAEVIEYFKVEDRVHLKVNAYIFQDGSSVTGDSIDYYITEQLVRAESQESPDGKRVQVVIEPKILREDEEEMPDGPSASE